MKYICFEKYIESFLYRYMYLITSEVPHIEISHTNRTGKHTHALLKFEPIPTDIKPNTTKINLNQQYSTVLFERLKCMINVLPLYFIHLHNHWSGKIMVFPNYII